MRLPRNLSGMELAALLRRRYGYNLTRQTGSHMRLTSTYLGYEHHVSVPCHNPLKLGTLAGCGGLPGNFPRQISTGIIPPLIDRSIHEGEIKRRYG